VDDYLTLVDPPLQEQAEQVAAKCLSVEAWLVKQIDGKSLAWDNRPREILFHGHCHQKALWGTQDTLKLLQTIPQASVSEIDSGCCGAAGSFGYEHYDVSLKIAQQRLLPAIEAEPNAIIVAPGTSCRTQISEAGHRVWHPVEVVAEALNHSPGAL
jgi:Fe-S oxidoreductase